MNMNAALRLARDTFVKLDRHWKGDRDGMARPGYSAEESEAIGIIAAEATALGMQGFQDLAGNTYFIYKGADSTAPVFMTGSHLDAVPKGGRYDGPAGVVAGLAAIRAIHESNVTPAQDICLVIWRNEESPWFGQYAVGSKFATGALTSEFLKAVRKDTGLTLQSHMTDLGLDGNALAAALDSGRTLLPLERIGALVEAHIEQGSQLEKQSASLGIVTGIRGNLRYTQRITFAGAPGHSGAVPQEERRDAVLAGADFLYHFQSLCAEEQMDGNDIVWSCPIARTASDASPTTIPAYFEIQPEVRSLSPAVLERVREGMERIAGIIEHETGVTVDLHEDAVVVSDPSPVPAAMQDFLEKAASQLSIPAKRLASGAGHDAGIVAAKGVPAGMLFIRHGNGGASHRPDEIMAREAGETPFDLQGDFANAVRVLISAAQAMPVFHQAESSSRSFAEHLQQRGAKPL